VVILVIIYSAANILSYYALARVDASVYSVTLQLKIFTTAAFAVLILGRNISSAKWRALIMLVLGCVLVASPTFNKCECSLEGEVTSSKFSLAKGGDGSAAVEAIFGIGALLAMVIISGYSAVYFEGMLKKQGEKITIWERNFQLALYSIVLLVTIVLYEMQSNYDPEEVTEGPIFFKGWTFNAVALALLQSGGGLLVAATLKYADAILKTLATAGAIVLSTVLGWLLLGGQLDMFVGIGCLSTILAIFNYILDTTV
jgi:solute carrier family 35 (UDP-sugar transporter), member A1/2/3